MPSNVTTDPGTGGSTFATKQISHDGDTAQLQMIGLMGIAGTEDSYTAAAINGDASNGIDVDVTRSALPSGAATAANQSTANGLLTTIDTDTGSILTAAQAIQTAVEGTLTVDGSAVTQPVSHTGLTELAAAINASSQIDINFAAQDADVNISLDGETVSITNIHSEDFDTGAGTDTTIAVGIALPASGGAVVCPGDATAGLKVDLGSDNDVTISGTVTVDNAGTFAVQAAQSGTWNVNNVSGTVSLPTGASTAANQSTGNGLLTTIDSDTGGILTAVQVIDNTIIVDDAAFTPTTTSVNMAGFTADEASTDSVDEGDAGAARMTLDRKQITTPYVHAAAGGCTPYKNIDVDESEDDIKTSAGKLFWLHCMNMSASVRYLKIYDSVASSVTVGTTVPTMTFPIPTLGDTNGAGFVINFGASGMQFSTGICIAATTGLADNDSGAPGANEVVLNAGYI